MFVNFPERIMNNGITRNLHIIGDDGLEIWE